MIRARLYRYLLRASGLRGIDEQLRVVEKGDLQTLAARALDELLDHAARHNRYYAQFATDGRLALEDLPVLTKQTIRREFDALTSPRQGVKTFLNSSGGSTGEPQTFVQDRHFASWGETTSRYWFRHFLGVDPDPVRKVVLWGSERDVFGQRDWKARTRNWLSQTLFLNSFRVDDEDWRRYLRLITDYEPYFIRGYAGSLYELARMIERDGVAPYRPHFLVSSAEMLRPFMRDAVERAYERRVYDFYGSREVGPIAGECREGNRHVFTFNNWVEVTEDGRILVTNLHNYSMPLIRYAIGDTGELGEGRCACGSELPFLARLTGRVTDHFVKPDGSVVHGEYVTHLFYHRPWVRAFQATQLTPTEVEILVVRSGDESADDMREITDKIKLVMGEECRVAWRFVDEIPKTAQGKYLFTRSLVPH